MDKRYLKKIIAQTPEDLKIISACCSEAKILVSEIKYLPLNKIILISLTRLDKENENDNKKINSILKFEYIDISKSKNIDQNDKENILELLAIEIFKKEKNYEIVILFSNNGIITLNSEVIEIELDNIEKIDDKN